MIDKLVNYIKNKLKVLESNSSEAFYNSMERQCLFDIPGVYRSYDPHKYQDWLSKIKDMNFVYNVKKTSKVLDIGCGDGYPSLVIAPHCNTVIGIDYSEMRVSKSQDNAMQMSITNVEFKKMNANKLAFADNNFDLAVAASSIEQTPDYMKTLKEIYRVLKPGGKAVISSQNFSRSFINTTNVTYTLNTEKKEDYFQIVFKILSRYLLTEEAYVIYIKSTIKMKHIIEKFLSLEKDHMEGTLITNEIARDFLDILNKINSHNITCLHYKLIHFSPETMYNSLNNAGFKIIEHKRDNSLLYQSIMKSFDEKNLLSVLSPYFEDLCKSIYNIDYPSIKKQNENLIFHAYK